MTAQTTHLKIEATIRDLEFQRDYMMSYGDDYMVNEERETRRLQRKAANRKMWRATRVSMVRAVAVYAFIIAVGLIALAIYDPSTHTYLNMQ